MTSNSSITRTARRNACEVSTAARGMIQSGLIDQDDVRLDAGVARSRPRIWTLDDTFKDRARDMHTTTKDLDQKFRVRDRSFGRHLGVQSKILGKMRTADHVSDGDMALFAESLEATSVALRAAGAGKDQVIAPLMLASRTADYAVLARRNRTYDGSCCDLAMTTQTPLEDSIHGLWRMGQIETRDPRAKHSRERVGRALITDPDTVARYAHGIITAAAPYTSDAGQHARSSLKAIGERTRDPAEGSDTMRIQNAMRDTALLAESMVRDVARNGDARAYGNGDARAQKSAQTLMRAASACTASNLGLQALNDRSAVTEQTPRTQSGIPRRKRTDKER